MRTFVDTLRESFFNQYSTPATHLGRTARVNLYHTAASFFRFTHRELYQLIPCYVRNAFSQMVISYHPVNVQVLKGDKAIVIDQFPAFFVSKVAPLIGNPVMNVSDNLFGLASFWCPVDLLAQFTLRFSQGLFFLAKEAGIGDSLTIREGQKRSQSEVNPYRQPANGQRLWLNFTRETSVPVANRITLDSQGFDSSLNRPVQFDFDIAYFGDGQPLTQLKARLLEGETIIPAKAFKAGEAVLVTSLDPAKERFESKVNPLLNILQDLRIDLGKFRISRFPAGQDLVGIIQAQALLLDFPRLLTQSKRRIIDLSANLKSLIKAGALRFGWKHSKPIRLSHTDFLRKTMVLSNCVNSIVKSITRTGWKPVGAGQLLERIGKPLERFASPWGISPG
jgi:hypothetical protein